MDEYWDWEGRPFQWVPPGWIDGAVAYEDGLPNSASPYAGGDPRHEAWLAGWHETQQEDDAQKKAYGI